jgi:5-(carboxyamino)imidazole ribonucleotide synthase
MIIGVIGGGQLGMMMAEEAKTLGHTIVSIDPNEHCSITQFSDKHYSSDYNNQFTLNKMNEECDVITYEFENVDLEVLNQYRKKIPQKLEALRISRHRITEKNFASSLGIETPKYVFVENEYDIFFPSIMKTVTGGYDGKGQYIIRNFEDIDQIQHFESNMYICEEKIDFDYEISVIATRDMFGHFALFPIPINKHKNGILHTSVVSNELGEVIRDKAYAYTELIMNELDYVGTLAVEFFVVGNNVLFNEFAPRPHNSGHYTMDGCNVSQFKNHILAITGEHLEEPQLLNNTLMINVLGQNKSFYDNASMISSCVNHDYFKYSETHNRKIGHINCTYDTVEEFTQIMNRIIKEK